MKPWFRTCPHHELLLSGFDAHDPNLDAMPSIVLGKRPADAPTEHRSLRMKMEDSPRVITGTPLSFASANSPTVPCRPPMPNTAPTVPQVTTLGSTIQPPIRESQCVNGDQPVWSGTLIWCREGSEVDAQVQATTPIRDPCVFSLAFYELDTYHVCVEGCRCGHRLCHLRSLRLKCVSLTSKRESRSARPQLYGSNACLGWTTNTLASLSRH